MGPGAEADRSLAATRQAVRVAAPIGDESGVFEPAAPWTDEAAQPARLLQRLLALCFDAVALVEVVQGHAVSKLDRVLF